ncbi:MAG: TonB-dependent receptor [Xanthomonadales bacterium]|nr:TonB-dependent receptor [Xanthomonadales bacterium]
MRNLLTLPTAAVLLAALTTVPVWAQMPEDPEAGVEDRPAALADLVVTASLEPVARNEVVSSVTVITREDIEARQVKYVGDLLRDVPGFNVSQSGGVGTQTQVRVRGAEANQLLVLVDGIRANDPANSDEFQWQFALTSDIERIEIVRGPQSAIWGSDAVAGVVNIIRRKGAGERRVSGRAELGSFDTVDLAVDGAWSREGLRLFGGVSWYDTEGINIARVGDEKDGVENTTANLGAEWSLGEAWTLAALGQFVDATTDFDDTDFFITGLPVDTDRVTENEQTYLQAEARYAPSDSIWSGNLLANVSDTDTLNLYDGDFNSRTAAEVVEFRARGSAAWTGRRGASHRVTLAADHRGADFTQRGIATDFGDPNQDQSLDVTGVAAEYLGQPIEGLTWTLSARYDDNSEFDNIATWRAGLSHEVEEGMRMRLSYGTGSKTPTFTERFGFFPGTFLGNPDLVPEESRGWEFGGEWDVLGERLTVGGAYYRTDLENEIDGFVFDADTFAFTAANRDSDSERKGFELFINSRPLDSVVISASYTYTDSTEDDAEGNSVREIRRPRHMASVNVDWRFAQDRAGLNVNVNYTGKQFDLFFDPSTFVSETVTLDAYTVVDLAGSWRLTDSLELVGRVANLFDEDYEEVLGYSRPGVAIYGGLRGRFDF